MAKKFDKVPRKQKKQIKKASNLQGQKVPKKEVNKLAEKQSQKEQRKAATLRRYNSNKKYLEKLGVPTDIISKSTSIKETEKRANSWLNEQRKEARRVQMYDRFNAKVQRLMDAGYDPVDAVHIAGNVWHQASNGVIDAAIEKKQRQRVNSNIKFTGDTYLYVGFADVTSGFTVEDLTGVDDNRLIDLINDRIEEALKMPEDTPVGLGVFKVFVGGKAECETMAQYWYKHGYNMSPVYLKLDKQRYSKITVSNTFSQREFHEMMYNCINQMRNDAVPEFIGQMREFCNANRFPFMRYIK